MNGMSTKPGSRDWGGGYDILARYKAKKGWPVSFLDFAFFVQLSVYEQSRMLCEYGVIGGSSFPGSSLFFPPNHLFLFVAGGL